MEIFNLIHHLKGCPESLLQRYGIDPGELLPTEIFVKDTYRRILGDFNTPNSKFPPLPSIWEIDENHLFSIQIGCWFFFYPFFRQNPILLPRIHEFLYYDLAAVCEFVNYREWVEDDDRAEEFARLALKRCEIVPDGETADSASVKFDSLDTIKRQKVLKETNASLQRVKEIRRAMAEKKAREAANVYGRE